MTMFTLPAPDADADNYRKELRDKALAAENDLADAEFAAAARIIRALWGEQAAELLAGRDDNSGTMTPLVLLDHEGKTLWFNCHDRHDLWVYPGAEDISDGNGRPLDDMNDEVRTTIGGHIEAGYETVGGVHGAFDQAYDEWFDDDPTYLLVLVIDDALASN